MKNVQDFLKKQLERYNHPKQYCGNYQWNHQDFYGQFLQDGTFNQVSIINGHKKEGFWWVQKQNELHFKLTGYWYKVAKMNSLEYGDLHLVGTGDFGKIKKVNRNYWGQSKYQGQMYPKQRIALYEEIKKKNPKICLQVGTWKGGGSTLVFGKVLKQLNNNGILYTCEPDVNFYNQAVKTVKESGYEQQVKLFNCKSEELIQKMIIKNLIPDFIFFDGPDIPEIALNDIKNLQPKLKQQTIFSMHDWIEDGGKCTLIKPYLYDSKDWSFTRIQSAPNSVGLVFWKYKIQKKIPKIIHACWMSGEELPELQKKCLQSWKKLCPDYEIKIWHKNNWDTQKSQFAYEAFQNKQWAFVSDVVRLDVLYEYGGIYLDFDVEIKKSFDTLLFNQFFTGTEPAFGFHTSTPYVMGAIENNELIKEFLDFYHDKKFVNEDGTFNKTENTKYIHNSIMSRGGQNRNHFHEFIKQHRKYPSFIIGLNSPQTYAVHHFQGQWRQLPYKKQLSLQQKFNNIYKSDEWTCKSGPGSTIEYTIRYRKFLQNYFKENNIKSVLDIGCGDWQFSKLIDWSGINYLGIDISWECIRKNIQLYKKSNIDFKIGNILQEDFEEFDLVVIKDVLQHLSNKNVKIVLQKLKKHNKVLITNDIGDNRDIKDGDFRYIDVRQNPFGLQCYEVFNFNKNNKVTLQYSKQQNQFDSILKLLKNVNENASTERYGPNEDGGYIVPSDIKYDKIITVGVGTDIRFQKDYLNKNKNCEVKFYDPTVSKLPEKLSNSEFNKIGLGTITGFKDLDGIIQHSKIRNDDKVLLKIDCEGGQWDCNFQKADLSKIHSIILEAHDFHLKNNWSNYEKVLQKIYNQFQCINLHPNNYGGTFSYKDKQIPKVIQLSFINKKNIDLITHVIRGINYPNNKNIHQIFFANYDIQYFYSNLKNIQDGTYCTPKILKQILKYIDIKTGSAVDIGGAEYGSSVSNFSRIEQLPLDFYIFDINKTGLIKLNDKYRKFKCNQILVTPENAQKILKNLNIKQIEILSTDIDGYDFFVIKSILQMYSPKIIIAQYNQRLHYKSQFSVTYKPEYKWDGSIFFGYGLGRLQILCRQNQYSIIYIHYNNVFLLRNDVKTSIGIKNKNIKQLYDEGYLSAKNRQKIFNFNNYSDIIQKMSKKQCDEYLIKLFKNKSNYII